MLSIPVICEFVKKPNQTESSVESQSVLYSVEVPLQKELFLKSCGLPGILFCC